MPRLDKVAMYLLIYELELSPTQVGRLLGGRDHATIIHGAGKINGEINEDGQLRQDVLAIKEAISRREPTFRLQPLVDNICLLVDNSH